MSIFNRFLNGGKPRKRTMRQQLDDMEGLLYEMADTLDKVHMDMWDKLTTLEEQGRARPSIVLGLPQPDGSMALAGYEPEEAESFEDFESFDDDGGEEVSA